MIRKASLLLLLTTFAVFSYPANPAMNPVIASLVEAEKEFAKTCIAKGMREAFLTYLSDESILFRPGPVEGRRWMEDHPAKPGILSWQPTFVNVSKSGDLGYTTGPWEFRKQTMDEQPAAFGHYVTIWKKPRFGSWRVVLDVGISHPANSTREPSLIVPEEQISQGKTLRKTDVESEAESLLKTDRDLSKQVSRKGLYAAISSVIVDDARFYRDEIFPILGKPAVEEFLKKETGIWQFLPDKAIVSGACDLGYSYGSYKFQKSKTEPEAPGYYVRIWKKNTKGQWKLELEISSLEPQAKQN